jgi:hypothetical protein
VRLSAYVGQLIMQSAWNFNMDLMGVRRLRGHCGVEDQPKANGDTYQGTSVLGQYWDNY